MANNLITANDDQFPAVWHTGLLDVDGNLQPLGVACQPGVVFQTVFALGNSSDTSSSSLGAGTESGGTLTPGSYVVTGVSGDGVGDYTQSIEWSGVPMIMFNGAPKTIEFIYSAVDVVANPAIDFKFFTYGNTGDGLTINITIEAASGGINRLRFSKLLVEVEQDSWTDTVDAYDGEDTHIAFSIYDDPGNPANFVDLYVRGILVKSFTFGQTAGVAGLFRFMGGIQVLPGTVEASLLGVRVTDETLYAGVSFDPPASFPSACATPLAWSADTKGVAATLSGSNLIATSNSSASGEFAGVRAELPNSTENRYFEVTLTAVNDFMPSVGVSGTLNTWYPRLADEELGQDGWSLRSNGDKYAIGSLTGYTSASTSGQTIMVAHKGSTGELWFGRNGTWLASGNPETGANPTYTSVTGPVVPAASAGRDGFEGAVQGRFKAADFLYPVPVGFVAWDSFTG